MLKIGIMNQIMKEDGAMRKVVVLAGAVLALSCASSSGSQKLQVAETDFARLSPAQMQPVDAARSKQMAAQDDLARAQLRSKNADHEIEVAQAEQSSADADVKKAEADTKVANDTRDPAALARAAKERSNANLRTQVVQAHLDYAQKQKAAADADVKAAQARVETAAARTDQAKLTALQDAHNPAAQKYSTEGFAQNVTDSENRQSQAEQDALQKRRQAVSAERDWNELQSQYRTATASAK
jgi:hypothetical protein